MAKLISNYSSSPSTGSRSLVVSFIRRFKNKPVANSNLFDKFRSGRFVILKFCLRLLKWFEFKNRSIFAKFFFTEEKFFRNYLMGAPAIFLHVTVPLAVTRLLPCHWARQSEEVFKSTDNFSQTFFLGFNWSSAFPDS